MSLGITVNNGEIYPIIKRNPPVWFVAAAAKFIYRNVLQPFIGALNLYEQEIGL